MTVALGTPLALVAGLITLAFAAAMTACLSLLPDRAGPASLITIAAAVGLPPALGFGARIVGIESTFEAGDFFGFIGIAAAIVWVLWMVAGARAIGLPAGRGRPVIETFPRVSMAIAALTLVAGPALAVIQTTFASPAQAEVKARALIKGAAIDVLVQPAARRRKRLLAADLEATIIENEMLDELADFLGISSQVSQITRRAMNGEIDFTAALEARVALFKGVEARVLEEAAARIRLTPGAHALVATMRRGGATTALVTGGFAVFAEPVAAALGFDHVIANRLDLAQGRITGTVRPPIVTGETKREALLALAAEFGITPAQTIAVGDGANDLTMLAAAGIGIAFRPKPMVAEIARWRLDHADLTGVLYAQGYRRDEIVA